MSLTLLDAWPELARGAHLDPLGFDDAWRQTLREAEQATRFLVAEPTLADLPRLAGFLEAEEAHRLGGVVVARSGDVALLRPVLVQGLLLLVGPWILEAEAAYIEGLKAIPVDHCVLGAPDGDAASLRQTAEALARIKGLTLEDVARVTGLNAHRLLGIGEVDQSARIAYRIRDSLYLNVTNRCSNGCTFCAKFNGFWVKGHQLRLEREPDVDEVMRAIAEHEGYDEVVFCGYGEPLLRLDLVKEVSRRLKARGLKVRINTDGQANLVYGRNVLPELEGLVDAVSVSLNAADAETYQTLCRTRFKEAGYEGVKAFISDAVKVLPEVAASAVALPGVDMDACQAVAESLGATFRYRTYQEVG